MGDDRGRHRQCHTLRQRRHLPTVARRQQGIEIELVASQGEGRGGDGGPVRLGELLPVDESVEQERENLSAPSIKLMQTVGAAIREDLAKVKDVLDIFVRRGGAAPEELGPQVELLRKIGDTLGVLGLGREIAVIWVDAHADINTPEGSDSGNVHGMPVSFLTGLSKEDSSNQECFGWIEDDMRISVKKLVYIGLRDVDAAEKRILRENGIKAFSMFDIDRHGIGRVMEMALGHIGTDTPIHLSFDVDALDPMWAPSTGTPVRGGLTLREGDYICECVHETGSLIAVDLVEVNPKLATKEDIGANETIRAGCSLVRCALGESLL